MHTKASWSGRREHVLRLLTFSLFKASVSFLSAMSTVTVHSGKSEVLVEGIANTSFLMA